MNPHEPPAKRNPTCKELSPTPWFIIAGLCLLAGLWIAAPGLIYMLGDMVSGAKSYEADVSLFGILIAPGTAKWLTFGVAPILLGVSAYIAHCGSCMGRQHVEDPADESV